MKKPNPSCIIPKRKNPTQPNPKILHWANSMAEPETPFHTSQ